MRTLLMAITAIVVVAASCRQGERMSTVPLGNGLESYMEITGPDTLLGVRQSRSHEVVVTPAHYTSFAVEGNIIKGRKAGDDYLWVFTLEGKPIGRFETYAHLFVGDCYLGTDYKLRSYYFPKTGTIVNSRHVMAELDYLLYMDADSCWYFRNYEGELLFSVPDKAVILCEPNDKYFHDIKVAVGTRQHTWLLFNERGEPTDTLTAAQWRALLGNGDEQDTVGHAVIVVKKHR